MEDRPKPKFPAEGQVNLPTESAETGLEFTGYEISADGNYFNQFMHYDQLYRLRHGVNSRFFMELLNGRIFGTRCPRCGDSFVPPRTNCWRLDCRLQPTEWVEFPPTAKVHTWTVAGWSGRSSLKRLPLVLVYAFIGDSKVAIANELHGIEPWQAEFGMPLKVVFRNAGERVGAVTDFWFEPADGWRPPRMNAERKRIKALVEPVYAWVATMK
ncbi:MAG: hypothetical protein L0Z54_02785 [Thermoplasmata archaeon]|nr:hypothetical protein [Thermoplasmata archaeon]